MAAFLEMAKVWKQLAMHGHKFEAPLAAARKATATSFAPHFTGTPWQQMIVTGDGHGVARLGR
jgi:hypothetical protein